jgi:multidrug efflux pump subunit AcrA (membrane-fusion protein)
MKQKMKYRATYGALALLLLAASCKPKYDEVSPKIAPITEAVFASGSIEPKDAYILTTLFDGYIEKRYVQENDNVKYGQLLFRLDSRQQNTQVAIALTNLQYARISASQNSGELSQIRAQVDASRVKAQTDSVNMARFARLYTTHSVSKKDVDDARVTYITSYNNYRANLANYRATADKLNQAVATTESQLENAQAGDQYYDLKAMADGKVYQVFKQQGDLVRKGDQVAKLGNPNSIVINMDVDENNIRKVKCGQQVLVELNTEKDKTYEAYVSKIYPHFDDKSQSYKVEARFVTLGAHLIPGTQLQANIITNKKDNALLIPHQYLVKDNKVLVKHGKNIDTATITTGITSYDWVEVLSGLTTNDKIAKLK